jgi:hypothetical protein
VKWIKSYTIDEKMKNFMQQLLHTFLKQLGQGASKSSLLREVATPCFAVTMSFKKLLDDYIFFSSIHKNKLKIGKKNPKPLG